MFYRHNKSICSPKEEVISTNKETVYMVVNLSFKKLYTF